MSDKNIDQCLSFYEAARRFDVPFSREAQPLDKEIVAGDLRFHYLDWGNEDKQSILMLHGIAQQAHSWDFVSLALSDRYHVIAMDARGHGDSQWPEDGDYSLEAHQRDLDGFVKALGLKDFILIGHSMGGRNGYVFTSGRPEVVKALVIVDTGPDRVARSNRRIRRFITLPDELDTYEEFAQRVMEYTGRPSWLVHGSLQHTIRKLPNGKWTWKYDKAIRSPGFKPQTWPPEKLWRCLQNLKCPTLVVRGAKSDVFFPEALERMLGVIPNSSSVVVARAGHLVPGDNPRGFLEALEPFLKDLN
ncbi:MAG: alpha/beta hydrolase [Chloroflexi bacterium]|nr:alpha/beta hydrolase [Chloroflexota bacterium]